MSTTTLIQRLRDLRNGLFPDIETVNKVLDDCIAQAEAQEGQAGELSDEAIKRILNANTYEDLNDSRQGGYVTSSDHDSYDMGMIAGLKYARDHYLKPSPAIGEQTPVASAHVCMGCFSQEAVCRQPGLCVSGRPKWIPSGVSPEARDRAIEAVEVMGRALANYESGVPIKVDDLRKWNSQALSALRA